LLTSNPRKGLLMISKKLTALLSIPISALLVIGGTQSSIVAFAATGIDGDAETDVTTSASADSILQCGWRIGGVATTIALANNVPTLKYIGSEYALAGEDTGISVFLSGGTDESVPCSFYNDYKGAQVKVSWDGVDFTSRTLAAPTDTSLSWAVSDKPLNITYTDADCTADWTAGDSVTVNAAYVSTAVVPASILATAVNESVEYDPSHVSVPTFPRCGFSATFSTAIPSNKVPSNPGSSYSFTGPTLTTTLVLEP
jgi:hypothetical protein